VGTRARSLAWKVGLAAWLASGSALAELRVTATPVLGPSTPLQSNWIECAVRIDNGDEKPAKGVVELTSSSAYPFDTKLTTRAPYSVAPGAAVLVRLPTRGFAGGGGPLELRVLNENGREVAASSVNVSGALSPMLLDMTDPPRLAGVLRDVPISVSYDPTGGALPRSSYTGNLAIATGAVRTDPATGDPVLPDRAAGYASATVVVMHTDQLARMSAMAADALSGFVMTGGTLALVVTRPEDLRNATLTSFVGGEVATAPAPKQLASIAGDLIESPEQNQDDPPRRRPSRPRVVLPGDDVSKALAGFSGGNLRPSVYGASASYGLGEVHLLAFDPTQAPGVDDPWVRSRMVDLVKHAWDRHAFVVNAHGSWAGAPDELRDIHKALDPNEGGRWAIVVAAVLLIAYSVIAGPVSFARAAKRGRPLAALWHLPIYSTVVFFALVVIGIAAKGWTGKARHLTFVEALPGMSRAGAVRYRGFFTSESRSLTVRASDLGSVLDAATTGRSGFVRSLVVDRDGVTLEGLATMPWETVVVREDGFAKLGAGVSVVALPDGDLSIVNRTSRDLRAVIVVMPSAPSATSRKVYFFPRLKDGESRKASEGRTLPFTPWSTSSTRLTEYDLAPIKRDLENESKGLSSAWLAIGEATGAYSDWWPTDMPIVMAQMDGGEGMQMDGGLRVDQDRVLVRLVGYGGVP
jgi:hypothetical protein